MDDKNKSKKELIEELEKTREYIAKLEGDLDRHLVEKDVLRESEERYRLLAENAGDHIWIMDLDTLDITYSSPSVQKTFGFTPEENMNSPLFQRYPLRSLIKIKKAFKEELENENNKNISPERIRRLELEAYHKDGHKVWVEITARAIRDKNRRATSILGITRDISSRKMEEIENEVFIRMLEHRTMLFQTAANVSKSAIAILSPDELLQETVDIIQKRFNYYYVGIFLVDQKKEFALLKAATGSAGKELLAKGHKLPINDTSMIGWSIANTKAKIALDVGAEAVHFDNPLLPETRSEIALPLVIRAEAIGAITVQSAQEAAFTQEDIDILQTMGDQLAIAIQNAQLYEQAQRDIAQRIETEEELKKTQNYLANVVNSMPSALIGVDADAKVTQWNIEAQRKSGLPPSKVLGLPLEASLPEFAAELERIREAIRLRKNITPTRKVYKSDGETHYEDISIYPLIANGVEGAVIRIDDVTEQVRLDEMMVQSEKMLSVGGLAAGMAHEINNPLAGILQTTEVMKTRLTNLEIPANQRAAEKVGVSTEVIHAFMEARGIPRMLDAISEAGKRVAEIVENMLSFARRSESKVSSHNLSDLLDKTLNLAITDYDLKKNYDFKTIEIIKDYEPNLPLVPCEGSKLQQVFLNILRNGAQAMQSKKWSGKTKSKEKKPCFRLKIEYEEETDMVCVSIKDNGPGMDSATRKRVFEPFFTTKPVGEGTGLGLSVSYFIVTENYGGTLEVKSQPGKGATFIIRLPVKRESL